MGRVSARIGMAHNSMSVHYELDELLIACGSPSTARSPARMRIGTSTWLCAALPGRQLTRGRGGMAVLGAVVSMVVLSTAAPATAAPASAPAEHWIASWTASPTDSLTPFDAAGLPVPEVLDDQTLRMVVVPHLGGSVLRIHLSNRYGLAPAQFGDVTVGRSRPRGRPPSPMSPRSPSTGPVR